MRRAAVADGFAVVLAPLALRYAGAPQAFRALDSAITSHRKALAFKHL